MYFCQKCHTCINDSKDLCPRCGTKIEKNKKKKYNQFSSMKTFSKIAKYDYKKDITENEIKNEITETIDKVDHNETHADQYEYNKQYSKIDDTTKTHNEQYNYSNNYSNTSESPVNKEEDYLSSYIGNNYSLIKRSKISLASLFLGPSYLIYRKLFMLGIILYIIKIYLVIENIDIYITYTIIINIILSIKFKELYLSHTSKKIEQIKYRNSDKTTSEIRNICKRKGGTINIYILIILFLFPIMILAEKDEESTEQKTIIEENKSTLNTLGKLYYKIHEDFITVREVPDTYTSKIAYAENSYCVLTIKKEYSNETEYNYIINNIYSENANSTTYPITQETIQSTPWYKGKILNEDNTSYEEILVLKKDYYIYTVNLKSTNNITTCDKYKESLYNSLTFE